MCSCCEMEGGGERRGRGRGGVGGWMIEGVGTVKEQGNIRSGAITSRLGGMANFTVLEMHRSHDPGFKTTRRGMLSCERGQIYWCLNQIWYLQERTGWWVEAILPVKYCTSHYLSLTRLCYIIHTLSVPNWQEAEINTNSRLLPALKALQNAS